MSKRNKSFEVNRETLRDKLRLGLNIFIELVKQI